MSTFALPPLNPVLARELKQRMRGRLTWLVVTAYLAVLALILRFVYLGASNSIGGDFGDPLASASVGRSIFHWLLFFMLMLVCFIVPGLTASAISGERERQTLVSLQLTMLRPRSIILGKLLSSLAFTSFLVVASLPLLSVPFVVGGVSVTEVFKGVAMILLTAVVLACLAVACSALLRRTQAATVVAYGLTAALTIGTFIVYGGQRALDGPESTASPAILALNPFVATADLVQGRNQDSSFDSPFTGLVEIIRPDLTGSFGPGEVIAVNGRVIQIPPRPFPAVGPATTAAEEAAETATTVPEATGESGPSGESGDPAAASGSSGEAVAGDGQVFVPPADLPLGGVFIDDGFGGGFPQFAEDEFRAPRATVAGLSMWVAWLLGSIVVGGLALFVAVRRVSLPSARDSQ